MTEYRCTYCGQMWKGFHQCAGSVPLNTTWAVPVIQHGWMCPKCGSAHCPHVETCPQLGLHFGSPIGPATGIGSAGDTEGGK